MNKETKLRLKRLLEAWKIIKEIDTNNSASLMIHNFPIDQLGDEWIATPNNAGEDCPAFISAHLKADGNTGLTLFD